MKDFIKDILLGLDYYDKCIPESLKFVKGDIFMSENIHEEIEYFKEKLENILNDYDFHLAHSFDNSAKHEIIRRYNSILKNNITLLSMKIGLIIDKELEYAQDKR